MRKERKMLISIALIVIMLLNCVMPLVTAYAVVVDDGIVLNSKLYNAVKNELTENGVSFKYDDTKQTISISSEVMATITELNLNNYGLYDLTGLEKFVALKHLELSGNNLSKDSNLASIANLPLEYLDLSTNNIEDVREIDGLISAIQAKNGKVILTNQIVTTTEIVYTEENGTIEVELPAILEKAGFIKSVWKNISTSGPTIQTWPSRVTSTTNKITVRTSSSGLLKLEIYIYDNPTEAASASNLNKASENMLYQSKFFIYVVTHPEETAGIHIPDVNLYKEIKRQLTQGKIGTVINPNGNVETIGYTPNKELSSYPYVVDENGEILYDECTFETVGSDTYLTLVGDSARKYTIRNDKVYLYGTDTVYTTEYTQTIISTVDENGNITQKLGYKIPICSENETLYEEAYDEPQVFIIDDQVLMNKITSLILNNKQIRDITGLEYFVGLKSDLDVSQNYITNIDAIYNLQSNKDLYADKLRAKFEYYLKTNEDGNLQKFLSETTSSKESADKNIEDISSVVKNVIEKFEEGAKISRYDAEGKVDPEYANKLAEKAKEIDKLLSEIYGYTESDPVTGEITNQVQGHMPSLVENLANTSSSLQRVYQYLSNLYDVYNNEYKLLTILTDTMNYMNIEEYEAYVNETSTSEKAEKVVADEIAKLKEFETNKNFTNLEKMLLNARFGIDFEAEGTPLADYFKDRVSISWLNDFREIALYSEMANYCTIKRMEVPTSDTHCYCAEYLKTRINEFVYEGISVELEEKVLKNIENMDVFCAEYNADPNYETGDVLLDAYIKYCCETKVYTYETNTIEKNACEGQYDKVTSIREESEIFEDYSEIYDLLETRPSTTTTTDPTTGAETTTIAYAYAEENTEEIFNALTNNIPKNVNIFEYIRDLYKGQENDLYLYDEVVTLSTRLLNSDVSRYVYLPTLKKLNISYNADLEGIERLSELTSLRELYANANYLGNISDVNWSALKYLRKLGLAYNYITDITCLEVLDHIVDLDVSHNLLAGKFVFNFENSQKTLKNLDLSYNQIDDITVIQEFLDVITSGNYANFLANPNTLNIDLGYQDLEIVVDKTTFLPENPTTVDVELPKIFTQLLAIDTARTTFELTSLDGRIESEGRYVTLNTNTVGEKTGTVNVQAIEGQNTCVGIGTKATIKYKVEDRTVSEVTISPETAQIAAGEEQQFIAEVKGNNLLDLQVNWSVENNLSADTKIDADGKLLLGADETAEKIIVTATSNFDNTKSASAEVTVITREITTFDIEPKELVITKGESANFTVTIDGNYLRDTEKEILWEVTADVNTLSPNTVATADNNVLTLSTGADETARTLTITATSKYDATKTATAVATLIKKEVNEVVVTSKDNVERIEAGKTLEFNADVTGTDLETEDLGVTWSISGNKSTDTKIDQNGLLTIAADEKSTEITVTATSNFDNTKSTNMKVTVFARKVTGISLTPETATVMKGQTQEFTFAIEGENLEEADKTVTWTVEAPSTSTKELATGTNIDENGKLTVAKDELNSELVVKATSNFDNTKVATATITLKTLQPSIGSEALGYKVEDSIIRDVETKLPVEVFKTKLAENYKVVVKIDGENDEGKQEVVDGYMKTGMWVYIYDKDDTTMTTPLTDDNGNLLVFQVAVKGDVNKDGVANYKDANLIKAARADAISLTEAQNEAADINNNGKIDRADSQLLLYHRAEVKDYIFDYVSTIN